MEGMRGVLLPIWNHAWLLYKKMQIRGQSKRLTANLKTPDIEKDSLLSYDKHAQATLLDTSHTEHSEENTVMTECEVGPSPASSMYARDRSEMKRVFDLFDENRDGLICARELQLFMRRLGFEMSEEEVRGVVKAVDQNSDGSVDFDEFFSLYNSLWGKRTMRNQTSSAAAGDGTWDDDEDGALLEAFFVFDKNKDGLISASELQQVLLNLGLFEGKSLMSCQKMIETVDTDGNGQVDFFEFKVMMSSNAFQPR